MEYNILQDTAQGITIAGMLQIVKGWIPEGWNKLIPLAGIGLGVLYVFAVRPGQSSDVIQGLSIGAMLGILATGAHSGTKNGLEFLGNAFSKKEPQ